MAAMIPLLFTWMENLQAHRDNILFALATEDLTYIHMRSALAVQQASNPSLQLKAAGAPNNVEDKVNAITTEGLKKQQVVFEEFKEETESLKKSKDTKPDGPAWLAKLDAKREEMKKKSVAAIDASFDAAATYIQELPKEQQEPAANVFSVGADMITKAAEFVFSKIKELIGSAVDFLKGIWDKMVTTYNSVKSFIGNAISSIFGQRGKLGAIQPPTNESGLFEGSITFQGSVSLAQAATMVDTTSGVLDAVLEQIDGPKPEFTIVSSSVHKSQGNCTANVLFQTTKHADQLGRHFKGLFEKLGPDTWVTWTARNSQTGFLPSDDQNLPVKDTECRFSLTWSKQSHSLDPNAIQATLDYLQDTISTAVGKKYVVQTGPIEKTSSFSETEITCRNVPAQDASHVSTVMHKIFSDELERKTSLPNAPKVPTPDVFNFVEVKA